MNSIKYYQRILIPTHASATHLPRLAPKALYRRKKTWTSQEVARSHKSEKEKLTPAGNGTHDHRGNEVAIDLFDHWEPVSTLRWGFCREGFSLVFHPNMQGYSSRISIGSIPTLVNGKLIPRSVMLCSNFPELRDAQGG